MSLSEKAKTAWQIRKAMENLASSLCEPELRVEAKEQWVRLEDAQQEIDKYKTFRDNAIKKWCESQDDCKEKSEGYAKVCARLHERIIDLERERVEQKQTCDEIRLKLKFLDYEQYHGDLKQSLNPALREINKLLGDLLK